MARDHARVSIDVWSDPDWRTLSTHAQHLYLLLISQPNTTHAGTLPYTPNRWAQMASGLDRPTVNSALAELQAGLFVIVDEETDEALIRTFVRNDGVLSQPNVAKSALKSAEATLSPTLRAALAGDLERHAEALSELKGWEHFEAWVKANANPSPKGSEKGSGEASGKGCPTPFPSPPSPSPSTQPLGDDADAPRLDVGPPLKAAGEQSYSRTLGEWAVSHGHTPPDTDKRSDTVRWLLSIIDGEFPRATRDQLATARGRARDVIADYLEHVTSEKLPGPGWSFLGRQIAEAGWDRVLDSVVVAVESGAGLDEKYADDPLALLKYATAVRNGKGRAA